MSKTGKEAIGIVIRGRPPACILIVFIVDLDPITLNGTTDIIPLGQTAPGLQVPKLVVPMNGLT